MLRRFFRKHESYPGPLSADEFNTPITAFLDSRLAELDFVRPKQGIWVRQNCLSARPMIQLRHYKGAISAPVWGFALTYVPHFNNSYTRLSWHRTVKSARLDVFPFDEFDQTQELTRFSTPDDHDAAVKTVLDAAVRSAQAFFASLRTTEDLLPLFDRLRRDTVSDLGYWNYMNLPIAHAFTLRVTGDYAGGRSILDAYVQRRNISDAVEGDLLNRYERASADPLLL
ncbi:MAG: hypothetical protein AAFX10_01990 [Pseudomonadota bacterium]